MLTADLVQTHRRADRLFVRQLKPEVRLRALALSELYLSVLAQHHSRPREELEQALSVVPAHPSDRKLSLGLQKLLLDRCEFEEPTQLDPLELRREVFTLANQLRREAAEESAYDRKRVLQEIATRRGLPLDSLESQLFGDLRSAHLLIRCEAPSASGLIGRYEMGQIQAVLLRAVRVTLSIRSPDPAAYRLLFRKLKFLRLLHTIQPAADDGYAVEIDGPYSLFESVTKYGLQLALLVPALDVLERWHLEADIRWGKAKRPLKFAAEGKPVTLSVPLALEEFSHLSDESRALVSSFRALTTSWQISPSSDLLQLPGLGLCVPDFQFVHRQTGQVVYLEVMGFWSRQAVWRRVELVEAGLPYQIVFAVSHRLRVSEQALDDRERSCLYVYKGTLSAAAIARRLDKLGA